MAYRKDPLPVAERPEIPIRNVSFDLADVPAHWHSGNPWITHFFDGLSTMFPDGERFFVRSVKHYRDRITDPALKEQVRGFIGQEANHADEHEDYNRWLEANGYPAAKLERWVKRLLGMARYIPASHRLANTCALEHFTAIMARVVLKHPELFADAHPKMQQLWRWHALEETEHKAVAYDVYQTVAPGFAGYVRRIFVMIVTSIIFSVHILAFQLILVAKDGRPRDRSSAREARRWFWGKNGFLRIGLRHYLDYYRRDFHPWQLDDTEVAERWKAELAAASYATPGAA